MKKLYPLFCFLLFTFQFSSAQSPTNVFVSTDCNFVRNFSSGNGGFTSPSIYSGDNDVSFFYINALGAWIESSGLTDRVASIISPQFTNAIGGQAIIGFRFMVPEGTQYRVRIISGTTGTELDIVATTANGPVWDPLPFPAGNICLLLLDPDIPAGTPIRYEISFRATQAFDMLFDDFALNVATTQLPVTFLGFVGKKNPNGNIKLLWDVADEINVKNYVVERSLNGADFTQIGTVTATGSSNYSFEDNERISQTKYYRVKNVDIDGKSKYTPTIRIREDKTASGQIQLYPMPASSQVYVQHDRAPSMASITIYTLEGKQVKQVNVIPNSYQTSLNISDLLSGMYIIKYQEGKENIQSAKLIKN